jgi:ABC-type molybdate transport system substrate-binding protein
VLASRRACRTQLWSIFRAPLSTGADYGLTLLPTKNLNAAQLALFILSQQGRAILAKSRFDPPLLLAQPH